MYVCVHTFVRVNAGAASKGLACADMEQRLQGRVNKQHLRLWVCDWRGLGLGFGGKGVRVSSGRTSRNFELGNYSSRYCDVAAVTKF